VREQSKAKLRGNTNAKASLSESARDDGDQGERDRDAKVDVVKYPSVDRRMATKASREDHKTVDENLRSTAADGFGDPGTDDQLSEHATRAMSSIWHM